MRPLLQETIPDPFQQHPPHHLARRSPDVYVKKGGRRPSLAPVHSCRAPGEKLWQ